MHREIAGATRDEVLEGVRQFLRDEHGIELVGTLGFENAYALAMPRAPAKAMGVTRISDLTASAATLRIGGDYEFFGRPEWKALESAYQLKFNEQRMMDFSLMYQAAGSGQVDVIRAFSTDGRISAFDLLVLDDDRSAIPPYDAVILAGRQLVRERPGVIAALRQPTGTIDADRMRQMNRAVDQEGASIASVAEQFLLEIRD